jgi:hypothetical protein
MGSCICHPGTQHALKSGYVLKQIHKKLLLHNFRASALFSCCFDDSSSDDAL